MSYFVIIIFTGRKGGHKGRARMYTSPEEIDAQMKAEKEKKRVSEKHLQNFWITCYNVKMFHKLSD